MLQEELGMMLTVDDEEPCCEMCEHVTEDTCCEICGPNYGWRKYCRILSAEEIFDEV